MTAELRFNRQQRRMIFGITIVLLVGIALLWTVTNDGTWKYRGAKQQAARLAVAYFRREHPSSPLPAFMTHVYVSSVRTMTAAERLETCDHPTGIVNDPDDPRDYMVIIRYGDLGSLHRDPFQLGCISDAYLREHEH